ncbi:Fanconi anemia group J protein homolog [Phoenix dactylifera]|uniref:DNA 5'-3' helicase FANCJ n=1 Tax=Phoenix dactylifera TaxID=42345 RepID=A0A8B8ZHQ5_PHODC|nr:Fanconi anemia group J protein homolog [Phoenix dactylifera]
MTAAMDSKTPSQNPNSISKPNVYQIGGVPVEFPYRPYGSQLAFMGRVISTLDRARRQGHCHALIESPTGTGKSLNLLCSSLAWQQQQRSILLATPTQPTPDPLLHGGGFIPEPTPSRNSEQPPPATSARAQKRLFAPKIFYATRTHSQISQVIREFRKTSYRVPMGILASRKHYCINKNVCTKSNVDEECKLLLKDPENLGCVEFKNANKLKAHPSLQQGGCHEVHDIEDLVKVGRTVKGCPYFAAQILAEEGHIVFCPYSYIINPIVRRAMDVDIKGCIVILDEAHNIEDMAREGGSIDAEEEVLFKLQTELGQLCMIDSVAMIYRPLYDMIQGIISWISERKNNLQKREFENYSSHWTGDKAIRELQQAGITQQCFPILQECATKAIKAATDAEPGKLCLSGISAITLEGLFSSLNYFFSENGSHALDYQLALQQHVKRDGSNAASGLKCTFSLWCLNPAIVFREIANLSLSVILTSGTLSPMGSFASELGVQFEVSMEVPHVIDVDSQLWAAVIPSGPANCQLNASYKTADGYPFQDALGASLEEICKIVPSGALVFFPSYKLLEKLRDRWCQTGQWARLNAQKPIFVEPRGTMDEFEPVLRGYYDAIHRNNKTSHGKTRYGLKRVSKHLPTKEFLQNSIRGGAALLAVCRGKVSEGIDFSDENARVVVIVGIPFPNINDIQVVMKKKYNDAYKSSKNLLSGNEWYCHQAFRALNQAAGRCIRHRFDYGAIILLDERYKEERNLTHISRWIRNSIKQYSSFDESLKGLQDFFQNVERRIGPKSKEATGENAMQTDSLVPETNSEISPSSKQSISDQGFPLKKNQKEKKLKHQNRRKMVPENTVATAESSQLAKDSSPTIVEDAPVSLLKARSSRKPKAAGETNKELANSSTSCTDFENITPASSKYSDTLSVESSENILPQSLAIENTVIEDQIASPRDPSDDKSSYSTAANTCNQSLDGPSFSLSTTITSVADTPEKLLYADACNSEKDSSLNMSVNSHSQKRRRIMYSPLSSCTQTGRLSCPDAECSCQVNQVSSRNISRDALQRSESPLAYNCPGSRHKKPIQGLFAEDSCDVSAVSTDDPSMEKKLRICCSVCRSPLGIHENNFLVPCSLTSSSKAYLANVLQPRPPSARLTKSLPQSPQTHLPVLISDIASVDQRIFDRCTKDGAPQHDVWSEEDGCVFRTLTCPFCNVPKTLGVQVMATDASNVHLLNKVFFNADHVDMTYEQTSKQEGTPPVCASVPNFGPTVIQIEKYVYNPQLKNATKSKLRLPKRDHISSDQDGD